MAHCSPASLVGVLFGVEFLCLYVGLEHTTVARNTLLVNTMPFWMLIGGHFLLGEQITLRKFLGLLLAFAGLAAVFSDKLGGGGDMLFGDLLSLGSGFFWALTNILIKRSKLVEASAEKLLLYQLAGAAVVGMLVLPLAGPPVRDPALLPTLALLFPGDLHRRLHLCAVVLAAAPLSGVRPVQLHLPVAGFRCFVRRDHLERAADHSHFSGTWLDCGGPDHRQPAGAQADPGVREIFHA